jgi:DoxX-like family
LSRALWIIQGLLALLFLFTGGTKLVVPVAEFTRQMPMLSGWFLRFVGVCEVLGGIGLILPGLLRTQQWLTPVAAACLVIIMIGAIVVTLMTGGGATAVLPFVTGLLLVFVAYGRWRTAPHGAAANA